MKEIPLTRGKVALVDDKDFARLSPFKWCAVAMGRCWYAQRKERLEDGRWKTVQMHRVILDPSGGLQVDHIDGDGLNNRRANLRLATQQQNAYNRGAQKNNTSGHKGVTWDRANRKWQAQIKVNGRQTRLGRFADKEDAARAYDLAAAHAFGEFARI